MQQKVYMRELLNTNGGVRDNMIDPTVNKGTLFQCVPYKSTNSECIPPVYTFETNSSLPNFFETQSLIVHNAIEQGVSLPFGYLEQTPIQSVDNGPNKVTIELSIGSKCEFDVLLEGNLTKVKFERENFGTMTVNKISLTVPSKNRQIASCFEWLAKLSEKNTIFLHPPEKNLTRVYNLANYGWGKSLKPSRSFDSIFLVNNNLREIISDVCMYQKLFKRLSILENAGRRIYMFHGPPGSGKTSIAAAIANKLGGDLF